MRKYFIESYLNLKLKNIEKLKYSHIYLKFSKKKRQKNSDYF